MAFSFIVQYTLTKTQNLIIEKDSFYEYNKADNSAIRAEHWMTDVSEVFLWNPIRKVFTCLANLDIYSIFIRRKVA